jgi:hydrogenase maturation protease
MSWPFPVRIVGVGSPRGDDALAWEVIQDLKSARPSESRIANHEWEFHCVEGGQRLLELLDGRGALILVDALGPMGQSGRISCFDWPDPALETLRAGTTHDLGPAEALRLTSALNILPSRIVIYAIEAKNVGADQGLSTEVRNAIPRLVERILAELQS